MEKREANGRIKRTDAGKNKKDVRPDGKKKDAGRAGVPERKQKSLCPVSKKCGGCQLLDMPYSQQLTLKKKQLEETLKGIINGRSVILREDRRFRKALKGRSPFQRLLRKIERR